MRDQFPGCVEINGLVVVPEQRSRGIGSTIVRTADHNFRAAALYARLGYEETGCHYLDRYEYIDHHGVRREVTDPCRFLIKTISERVG